MLSMDTLNDKLQLPRNKSNIYIYTAKRMKKRRVIIIRKGSKVGTIIMKVMKEEENITTYWETNRISRTAN